LLTLKTNHDASGFYDVKGTWWAIYLKKYETIFNYNQKHKQPYKKTTNRCTN